MSAVNEYKHTSWSESCSLCVQLKTRADAAISLLEDMNRRANRDYYAAEEARYNAVKENLRLKDELATVNSLLDMKREREQHWSDEAWRYKDMNEQLRVKNEIPCTWKATEVALETMTQQRNAAIAKPARDRISALEAYAKQADEAWETEKQYRKDAEAALAERDLILRNVCRARDAYKAELADRDSLVKRAIERSSVTAVSPGECFDLLAKAEGLFEAQRELVKANTFIELLKGMVEQLEGDEFEEYDLEDLKRRTGVYDETQKKLVEVKGSVTEGRGFAESAMIEGVKFVICGIKDNHGRVDVTLVSVGKGKAPS